MSVSQKTDVDLQQFSYSDYLPSSCDNSKPVCITAVQYPLVVNTTNLSNFTVDFLIARKWKHILAFWWSLTPFIFRRYAEFNL